MVGGEVGPPIGSESSPLGSASSRGSPHPRRPPRSRPPALPSPYTTSASCGRCATSWSSQTPNAARPVGEPVGPSWLSGRSGPALGDAHALATNRRLGPSGCSPLRAELPPTRRRAPVWEPTAASRGCFGPGADAPYGDALSVHRLICVLCPVFPCPPGSS